ncbi:putative gustatory receptor 22a [Haematobia irritans]|uniref:putative gustatory receptor 22a n=1 Tax=Haematobia irritans TaxID=7368 RepID=UPI003F4FC7BD
MLQFGVVIEIKIKSKFKTREDLKKRVVKRPNRWIKFYIVLVQLIFLCIIPYSIYLNVKHTELFLANPVAIYANYATTVTRFLVGIISVCTLWGREANLFKWIENMLHIQAIYFDRFQDIPRDTSHRKWLYINSVLTLIHNIVVSTHISENNMNNQVSGYDLIALYSMVCFQHFYMLHHATALCYIRELLSVLNNQVNLKCLDPETSRIYSSVRKMLQELNVIHSPVILIIQLCLVISNSMVGYSVLCILMMHDSSAENFEYLFGDKYYLLVLVHMYTYFTLCEWLEKTIKEMDNILFQYAITTGQDSEAERQIDMIFLATRLYGPGVNILKIIDINWTLLFSIIVQTILYIIVLIQGDYANL